MRKNYLGIAAIGLTIWGGIAASQEQVICTISDCKEIEVVVPEFARAQSITTTQVWDFAGEILAVSGLAPNFQVVESRDIAHAAALMRSSERLIVFNPDWVEQVANNAETKWQVYAILAHEIGHHLQGHTLLGIGSRPPIELQADEYAGFALGALGATQEQATALWRGFDEQGSPTHPPRHQRLAAVERGWTRATTLFGARQPDPERETRPLPQPTRSLARDRSADASCVPVQTSIGQAVSCVTSQLSDDAEFPDTPALLFDGDAETTWTEDGVQIGVGETIAVDFFVPTDIRRVLFQNGTSTVASDRPRIRQLRVLSSSGFEGTFTLQDQQDWQFLPLPLGAVDWISFTIEDAYLGDGLPDTSLAEIAFE